MVSWGWYNFGVDRRVRGLRRIAVKEIGRAEFFEKEECVGLLFPLE